MFLESHSDLPGANELIKETYHEKLTGPRSVTSEKVVGQQKNMGAPIKLLYVKMFKIQKSCQKCIFSPVSN